MPCYPCIQSPTQSAHSKRSWALATPSTVLRWHHSLSLADTQAYHLKRCLQVHAAPPPSHAVLSRPTRLMTLMYIPYSARAYEASGRAPTLG